LIILKLVKKAVEKINQNEVVSRTIQNASWLIGDKVVTMIIGVFVTAIIARYFGPVLFGQFHYALSFVLLFTAISTLGLETLTVKAIVDKNYNQGTILCTSLLLRVIGGTLLILLAAIVIRIIEPNDSLIHLLVFIMSLTMAFKSLEVIEYWIQAKQKAKISSIIRMAVYFLSAGLKVVLVLLEGNLIHYALIYLLDIFIIGTALIVAYFIYRDSASKWRIDFTYAKEILSKSWFLILSGLMVTLYMQIDKVMLGSMLSTTLDVGVYTAAVAVASMWYFVPMAVITSFKPIIMSRKIIDETSYMESVQLLYTIVAWMGIGFGVIITLFSNIIIGLLYGPDYANAASILSISIWAGTFAMLGSARGVWIITEGLQKYTMTYVGSGAVINVVLNYLLIPLLGGYGAAIATLVSQIVVAIIVPALIKETRISSVMILRAFMLKGVIKKR
jgi:O-antigen/teichoic acid export membrane protein